MDNDKTKNYLKRQAEEENRQSKTKKHYIKKCSKTRKKSLRKTSMLVTQNKLRRL